MATSREKAAAFDAQDRPLEATQAYEQAIAEGDADLDTYIDLAVLYFECNDEGYYAYHHLSDDFIERAWNRTFELLDEAESNFGKHAEIEFWRHFFRYIYGGGPEFIPLAEELAATGESLVPYFYLYAFNKRTTHDVGEGRKYFDKGRELYDLVKDDSTAKKRYITSVLDFK